MRLFLHMATAASVLSAASLAWSRGVNDGSATNSIPAANWILPTNPVVSVLPNALTAIDLSYASRLFSAEVNWRYRGSDCVTWLAGFRWLQVRENLGFDTT